MQVVVGRLLLTAAAAVVMVIATPAGGDVVLLMRPVALTLVPDDRVVDFSELARMTRSVGGVGLRPGSRTG